MVPSELGLFILQLIDFNGDTFIIQHKGSSKEEAGCSIISNDNPESAKAVGPGTRGPIDASQSCVMPRACHVSWCYRG